MERNSTKTQTKEKTTKLTRAIENYALYDIFDLNKNEQAPSTNFSRKNQVTAKPQETFRKKKSKRFYVSTTTNYSRLTQRYDALLMLIGNVITFEANLIIKGRKKEIERKRNKMRERDTQEKC